MPVLPPIEDNGHPDNVAPLIPIVRNNNTVRNYVTGFTNFSYYEEDFPNGIFIAASIAAITNTIKANIRLIRADLGLPFALYTLRVNSEMFPHSSHSLDCCHVNILNRFMRDYGHEDFEEPVHVRGTCLHDQQGVFPTIVVEIAKTNLF